LIRSTALQQWRLLAVNLCSSAVDALSEGAALAVVFLGMLLQALQSLSRFANTVSAGHFPAECNALVTALIHSQVQRLSFPSACGTKVGDRNAYASQGAEAIRMQVEQSGQLLVLLLLSSTSRAVLVGISPWLLLAVAMMGGLNTAAAEAASAV
jgi:subfamily B ATP-binding cassette protein MsbA